MPAAPDPQTDYEDPVDRLFNRQPARHKRGRTAAADDTPQKTPSATAAIAYAFGLVSMVPFVGLVFGPLAVVIGWIGLTRTRNPGVSGKEKARSGVWFGFVGILINYLVPLTLYLIFRIRY
ncbi:MAG: hypothetical protein MUF18_00570 [Fimbriiglobus sp.]|jgi:hypothetical protein|nr:hypothetical protein [Fimbriiglobus sp.]